jgi:hypothetical protein
VIQPRSPWGSALIDAASDAFVLPSSRRGEVGSFICETRLEESLYGGQRNCVQACVSPLYYLRTPHHQKLSRNASYCVPTRVEQTTSRTHWNGNPLRSEVEAGDVHNRQTPQGTATPQGALPAVISRCGTVLAESPSSLVEFVGRKAEEQTHSADPPTTAVD